VEWVKVDKNGTKKRRRRARGGRGAKGQTQGEGEGEEDAGEVEDEILVVVEIPPDSMGLVIGRQGTSIKAIRSACSR